MMEKSNILDKARIIVNGYLIAKGLKEETITRKTLEVRRFLTYVDKTLKKDLRDVTSDDIEEYFTRITEQGFSKSTLITAHSTIGDLFMALFRQEMILTNPMEQTNIYIREKAGAKVILTEKEMELFLNSIDTSTGFGLRDRALFELMYVTGIRIGEVRRLDVAHIDFSLNEVFIQKSKNRKDRIVPLGRVAKQFLEKWVKEVRAYFLRRVKNDPGALFLSEIGARMSESSIRYRLKRCLKIAGIKKEGISPHSIRHTCATHLLAGGADIRFVQELLGHESIETTVSYTKGVVAGLKKVHKMYHPRENQLYIEEA
jgi:integrase/recombinase XerD